MSKYYMEDPLVKGLWHEYDTKDSANDWGCFWFMCICAVILFIIGIIGATYDHYKSLEELRKTNLSLVIDHQQDDFATNI